MRFGSSQFVNRENYETAKKLIENPVDNQETRNAIVSATRDAIISKDSVLFTIVSVATIECAIHSGISIHTAMAAAKKLSKDAGVDLDEFIYMNLIRELETIK